MHSLSTLLCKSTEQDIVLALSERNEKEVYYMRVYGGQKKEERDVSKLLASGHGVFVPMCKGFEQSSDSTDVLRGRGHDQQLWGCGQEAGTAGNSVQ